MFSLKDKLDLFIDRFRAMFKTKEEEKGDELIAIYEFKITEADMLQRILRAVREYRETNMWDDDRKYQLETTTRNVLMEVLIKTVESFGYEVTYDSGYKKIEVRKND